MNKGEAGGVYIHFPFCLRRCPYCDFSSSATPPDAIPHRAFADDILRELSLRARDFPSDLAWTSVYIGGGTPSLWDLDALARLLDGLGAALPTLASDAERTIECNPATVDARRLRRYRELGFTRLSIGVQSLSDRYLRRLGRVHDAEAAATALRLAADSGVPFGADLLFGLRGDTSARLEADLASVIAFGPSHLSVYEITLYEGTAFHARTARGERVLMPEDARARMLERLWRRLPDQGFEHYEVSNFARPGHRSRHNQLYWRGGFYAGLGPAAHGHQPMPAEARDLGPLSPAPSLTSSQAGKGLKPLVRGSALRYSNDPDRAAWSSALSRGELPPGAREEVTALQRFEERVMLGLRTRDGVDLAAAADATRTNANAVCTALASVLERLETRGLLIRRGSVVAPTFAGMLRADALAAEALAALPYDLQRPGH